MTRRVLARPGARAGAIALTLVLTGAVADAPSLAASHGSTEPVVAAAAGDPTLFFAADGGERGNELWGSDGTRAGTRRVKDILPGKHSSNPSTLATVGRYVYFIAEDEYADMDPERELWRSDGTRPGTEQLGDTGCPSGEGFGSEIAGPPVRLNGILYFSACDHEWRYSDEDEDGWGQTLWRTKGTNSSTRPVLDIDPKVNAQVSDPVVAGDLLFFSADDGVSRQEIWRSDGSAAGTVMIEDINPAAGGGSRPYGIVPFGERVLFGANDGVNGDELWISDGTDQGTFLLKDINPNGSSLVIQPKWSDDPAAASRYFPTLQIGDVVFFPANDGTNGAELWRTDGTEDGTYMVGDINPAGSSDPGSPMPHWYSFDGSVSAPTFAKAGGVLYFGATDGSSGVELWRSDGTADGTSRVANINRRPKKGGGERGSAPVWLTALRGLVLFGADDGTSGYELWRSDGTKKGTSRVANLNRDDGSKPQGLTRFDGQVFFAAKDDRVGWELWRTARRANDVVVVKDIRAGEQSSRPNGLIRTK